MCCTHTPKTIDMHRGVCDKENMHALQWRHTSVKTSEITGKSTACSIYANNEETIKAPRITGHLWRESTGDR